MSMHMPCSLVQEDEDDVEDEVDDEENEETEIKSEITEGRV